MIYKPSPMRIAALQMNSTDNKLKNLKQADQLVKKAVGAGARFLALPEYFSLLSYDGRYIFKHAEQEGGATTQILKNWAKQHKIWIHGGTIPLRKPKTSKVTNTSLLISPQGKVVARYDKMHLFDADLSSSESVRESRTYAPGRDLTAAKTPFGNIGFSICYDLRFPELFRILCKRDIKIIFAPSSFMQRTGVAHWDVLTRARAIENQAYLVAAAQTNAASAKHRTHGHSRIIGPWGNVIQEIKQGVGIIVADLDFKDLAQIRRRLPALKNRRIALSGSSKLFNS